MTDTSAAAAHYGMPSYVLRCPSCDVTWRGTPDVSCWCCGARGLPCGEIRLVRDDED